MKHALLVFFFSVPLFAKVPANHVRHRVVYKDTKECVDFHIIRPREMGVLVANTDIAPEFAVQRNSDYASQELKRLADFIWEDAKNKDYLNSRTTPHYQRELEKFRQGYWPTIYVTPCNSEKILFNLTFAIQWPDDLLHPFQHRFYGHGVNNEPPKALGKGYHSIPGRRFPTLMPKGDQLFETLNILTGLRPYQFGTSAEIKFLVCDAEDQSPSEKLKSLRFVPVIWRLSRKYQLHLRSMIPVTDDYNERLQITARSELVPFANIIMGGIMQARIETDFDRLMWTEVERHFTQNLFSPQLQKQIFNDRLYFHLSDLKKDNKRTQRTRQFMAFFGVSEPNFWNFAETDDFGTEGIWTDIGEESTEHFDGIAEQRMNEVLGQDIFEITAIHGLVPELNDRTLDCVDMLSENEYAIQFPIMRSLYEKVQRNALEY